MNNTVIKAHPIMTLNIIKFYLFVLRIPVVRIIILHLRLEKTDKTYILETIIGILIFLFATIARKNIFIVLSNEFISINKGILIRSRAVINKRNISWLCIKKTIFDKIFKSVGCEIYAETERNGKFFIKLSENDAKRLYKSVFKEENMTELKSSSGEKALLAARLSSSLAGLAVGIASINKTSDLLGITIKDVSFIKINVFPKIINYITVILFAAYFVSFAVNFVICLNTRFESSKQNLKIKFGFLSKKNTILKKKKINNVCFEQNIFMAIIKKQFICVFAMGEIGSKGKKPVLTGVVRQAEQHESITKEISFLKPTEKCVYPSKNKTVFKRITFFQKTIAFSVILATIGVGALFSRFIEIILIFGATILVLDLCYMAARVLEYKRAKVCFGDQFYALGAVGLKTKELYCKKSKIGTIKIIEFPKDKKLKTCKIKVTSSSNTAVIVRHLDKKAVIKGINESFYLNLVE